MDPERRRMLMELAAWHREWQTRHDVDDVEFVPERPQLPGPQDVVFFGADRSRLLDAGEWLLVSDLCAQAGSVPAGSDQERAEVRESMAIAAAAVAEVLKFVPSGADEVPDSAFWSDRGRTVREQEPGRFRRRRLDIVGDTYRDALDRL
jgi:hypothetical protein